MNLVTVQQENIKQVTTNTESLALDQVEEEFRDVFKGQGYLEETSPRNWQDSHTGNQPTSPSSVLTQG